MQSKGKPSVTASIDYDNKRSLFEGSVHVPFSVSDAPQALLFSRYIIHTAKLTASRHDNNFWVLDCHLRHAGEYSLDGRHWEKRMQNTVHLYAPGTIYWERSQPEETPFEETYLIFQAKACETLDQLVAPGKGFARFSDPTGRMVDFFNLVLKNTSITPSPWAVQGMLLTLLDLLIASSQIDGFNYKISPLSARSDESFSGKVDTFLSEHFHERVSLDRLAKSIGVSRSTLSHRYRLESGLTPAVRLNGLRLNAARAMILKGEPLKVVATRTGFCDQYHLSKAFRRHFGISPRTFRNQATDRM